MKYLPTISELPLYNFFKSMDSNPEYFDKADYWLDVLFCFLMFIVVIIIIWFIYYVIYSYFDKRSSTKEILTGTLIDKHYVGEQSGVGVISTSSHSDEEFLFFVQSDKVYKIKCDMQQFSY
jgi:hypothetical protein